ncbi:MULTISPECIES: CatB-related O-acetyltransferase [Haloferax]|uniref:LpxA family protein n=1 Tax=Haloferax gibbonsii TaxID=35746 RepID=A0A871BFY5_HALGI|nr:MULTISPECIES: CatB-related O-acetyltransferase [Haloferax]QOS11689.1 LpxA family protein [Haloferax gibbonsii]
MRSVKTTVESVVSRLGYPEIATTLIDKSPAETNFSRGRNVGIESGCSMRGDISLGDDVHVGPDCVLNGTVGLGRGTNLNGRNTLRGTVDIGRYCAVAPGAEFRSQNHTTANPTLQLKLYRQVTGDELAWTSKGDIDVGSDVWIGSNATVLSGVSIGHGAIVGAGAVVTSDVEPYAVVAGVPAERKKWRFDEHIREELLDTAWWNWSEEKVAENRQFFETDLTSIESVSDVLG